MSNTLKFGSNADTSRRPTSPRTLSVHTIQSNQSPKRKSAPTNPVPKSSPRNYSLSQRQRPPPVRSPLTSASTEWTPPRTPSPATPPTPSPGRPPLLSPWPGYRKNPLQHLFPPSKTPRSPTIILYTNTPEHSPLGQGLKRLYSSWAGALELVSQTAKKEKIVGTLSFILFPKIINPLGCVRVGGSRVINPRRACAARVTVVVLCTRTCLSVCPRLFSDYRLRGGL